MSVIPQAVDRVLAAVPLRVLVVGSTFPKWRDDSTPRFVLDTCIALQGQGLEVLALAPHAAGARVHETLDGVRVVRYPYCLPALELISGEGIVTRLKRNPLLWPVLLMLLFAQAFAIGWQIVRFKPDRILVNWLVPEGLVVRFLALFFRGIDYAIVVHGVDAAHANANFATRALCRWILGRAGSVVAVSRHLLERIRPLLRAGTPVEIISMGAWPRDAGAVEKDIDVLFVGRLEEKKGVAHLLDALALLKRRGTPVSARIVGSGSLRDDLEAQACALGLAVCFAGAVPNREALGLLARARILALPSVDLKDDVEGMPTVIAEAMSRRAVVVATDAGGTRDAVEHERTGLLVPQRDPEAMAGAIARLLGDPALAEKIRDEASDLAMSRFSYQSIGRRLAEALRD